MGKQSISWLPHTYPKSGMMWEVRFARKDCTPCPHRAQCTRAKQEPRIVGLKRGRPRRCKRPVNGRRRKRSAGSMRLEQGSRVPHAAGHPLRYFRQARDVGLAKTHFQHLATAAALNFVRLGEWLTGTPRARTRGPFCCPEGCVGIRHQCQCAGFGPTGVSVCCLKPQPSMHATSPLLKDHILLVRLAPVMPEDNASDGFDAGRPPKRARTSSWVIPSRRLGRY